MAYDFPSSPTVGQSVTTPAGSTFIWDGVKWTSSSAGPGGVGRNTIHNPMFNIAQRGAGPWTGQGYLIDRWCLAFYLCSGTHSRQALTDADRAAIGDEEAAYSMQMTFTGDPGASAYMNVTHRIENLRRIGGKTITVSFWAKSSNSLKLGVAIDQVFGGGGSPSPQNNGLGVPVQLSPAWVRYSVQFATASLSGKILGTNGDHHTQLGFWYSAVATYNSRSGSIGVQSGDISLWGVQLEIGSSATPLEKPDPQVDMANCQRFYQLGYAYIGGYDLGGTGLYYGVSFNTWMRATPTVALSGQGYINASGASVGTIVQSGFVFQVTVTASSAAVGYANFAASADL